MHSIKTQSVIAAAELISLQRLSQLVESINLNKSVKQLVAKQQPATTSA